MSSPVDPVDERRRFFQEGSGIFQRFNSGREVPKTWSQMIELPFLAVPQTTPDARIVANEGINLVTAYRPENRAFFSRSYGYAHLEWAPSNAIKSSQVVTLDVVEILNFRLSRVFILNFGVGLGLLHGVSVKQNGDFQARFEPFIPVQIGALVPLGRTFTFGVKLEQDTFLGNGPSLSVMRGLVGFGYNY